ncbi:helix-turn-helix domain-containing protein [Halorussus sp. MSC15.2]|uniref:helix-turn-helix domain-containing protein n=1 Tax=Halorussus sp. MSC15.2 TaxID=2283638 RepID=UPI0013D73E5E|nr:helix-turn-helix domain-containing protein [Halorussus sp. MSC15.2]NEU59003.1 hypothetical protein [Halorussus sp. MSC15.2]
MTNIQVRAGGISVQMTDGNKPWRDEQRLRTLYVEKRLSTREIGERLDCSRKTVEKWIREYELKTEAKPWQDEATLSRLRNEEYLSQAEIAERFDCSQTVISYWLREFDLESGKLTKPEPWRDEEVLRRLYVEQQLTMAEVADTLQCSREAVEEWIHRHGIGTRSRNPDVPEELTDRDTLQKLYIEAGMSTYQIGEKLDCAPSTVFDWLREHGIETRSVGSQPGELHHRWRGGGDPYYGENWHEQRRTALRRDGFECQKCGISEEEHRESHHVGLDVHHIVPLRDFSTPEGANRLENLVTLCRNCHNKVEAEQPDTVKELL